MGKPYRSKAFKRFCHERMRGICCICTSSPWTELHHFGVDGGMGMKPSDLAMARVCKDCHDEYPHKAKALCKNGDFDILFKLFSDSNKLVAAWIEHLESGDVHVEDCALEDLNRWLLSGAHDTMDMSGLRAWIIQWADRRAANLYSDIVDGGEDGND